MLEADNLPIRRHGENVKPIYQSDGATGRAGVSTDAERTDGQTSGIVKRFKKHQKAADIPCSLGLIKSQYSEAVEVTGIAHGVRGMVIFMGLFTAAIGIGFGQMLVFRFIERGLDRTFNKIFLCIAILFILLGFYYLIRSIRQEFFRPQDEPMIFDRARRKVYRLFREVHPGWRGLLMTWPIRAVEYEWDLIDVEHNATIMSTGSTVTRLHNLIFIVRRSPTDPTIIDSFEVGNTIQLGEPDVAPLWEHIRRFMEERGPHIPEGESLIEAKPPHTLWESMGAVGPIGPEYFQQWRTLTPLMVIYHVLFPLFLPMFLLLGLFNWLSYKTATPIRWPDEIRQAVGAE